MSDRMVDTFFFSFLFLMTSLILNEIQSPQDSLRYDINMRSHLALSMQPIRGTVACHTAVFLKQSFDQKCNNPSLLHRQGS